MRRRNECRVDVRWASKVAIAALHSSLVVTSRRIGGARMCRVVEVESVKGGGVLMFSMSVVVSV